MKQKILSTIFLILLIFIIGVGMFLTILWALSNDGQGLSKDTCVRITEPLNGYKNNFNGCIHTCMIINCKNYPGNTNTIYNQLKTSCYNECLEILK